MVVLYKQFCLCLRAILIFVAIVTIKAPLSSQTDTLFWFAAPDCTSGHGELPIYLRLTTLEDTAEVRISQPAQSLFNPINIKIEPNTSYSIELSAYLSLIENDEPAKILNKGLLIESSSKITAYYENSSFYNPEIFTLKGQKALGTEFVIPMQDLFSNSGYSPTPYASFNIVATEDSTKVNILPSHDLYAYDAGEEIKIILNRGETFVAQARERTAGYHLGGSIVSSDKKIAITIKDDSMGAGSIYGGCSDLGGDQITPVDFLGREYVSVPGSLNGPNDVVFIYAVSDNTDVYINGILQGTIDRQESLKSFSYSQPMYIQTSKPSYVLHMSGFGCELGLDQLPPVDPCYGSNILSVNRSTNQAFFLNILVYQGMEDSFLFNGRSDVIQGSNFTEVPGTSGDMYYTRIEIPLSDLGAGQSAIIKNTKGPFHLAIIHGGPSSGTMYGYFSDYGDIDLLPNSAYHCDYVHLEVDNSYIDYLWSTGDTTSSIDIMDSGVYSLRVTNKNGCVSTDEIYVDIKGDSRSMLDLKICENDTIIIENREFHSDHIQEEILLANAAVNGCDSIIDVFVSFYDQAVGLEEVSICKDDSIQIMGRWLRESGEYVFSGQAQEGCDSTIQLIVNNLEESNFLYADTLCPDEYILIERDTFDLKNPSGRIVMAGSNKNGCDSIIDIQLSFYDIPLGYLDVESCFGDTVWVEGIAFYNGHEIDTILLEGMSEHSCDSLLLVRYEEFSESIEFINPFLCLGDTLEIENQMFYGSEDEGMVLLQGADRNGCDSTIVVNIEWYPESELTVHDTLCVGEELFIHNTFFNEERRSGTLVLSDSGQYGCDSMIHVELYYPDTEVAVQDSYEINYGETVLLEPDYFGDFTSWEWSPAEFLDCSDCEMPYSSPLSTVEYTLKTSDAFGCNHFVETRVLVKKEKKVYIPNIFSPNGDGVNDEFTVFGNYFVDQIESMEIYDRWGELVEKIENFPDGSTELGWDGSFRDEKVEVGVFCYKIKVRYFDGSSEIFVGDLTIVR